MNKEYKLKTIASQTPLFLIFSTPNKKPKNVVIPTFLGLYFHFSTISYHYIDKLLAGIEPATSTLPR